MNLSLKRVDKKEKRILGNLYSLYLHDLSKFTDRIDLEADGSFHFDGLNSFWEIEGISPYFIYYEDSIIGFLLLIERPFLMKENDFGVNDLFIINKYRGKGIGKQIINRLFKEKCGKYFIIQLVENEPAILFWKNVYKHLYIEFEERTEIVDEELCLIQTFHV